MSFGTVHHISTTKVRPSIPLSTSSALPVLRTLALRLTTGLLGVSKSSVIHLMPLTMGDIPNVVDVSSLKADKKRFLALIDSTNQSVINPESPYSLIVNVEVKFTKSKDKDAILVRKTVDKSATPIRLTEEAVRERYPWDYRTLTDRCKQRYDDFKENQKYHDLRKRIQKDERYGHQRYLDPGNEQSSVENAVQS